MQSYEINMFPLPRIIVRVKRVLSNATIRVGLNTCITHNLNNSFRYYGTEQHNSTLKTADASSDKQVSGLRSNPMAMLRWLACLTHAVRKAPVNKL